LHLHCPPRIPESTTTNLSLSQTRSEQRGVVFSLECEHIEYSASLQMWLTLKKVVRKSLEKEKGVYISLNNIKSNILAETIYLVLPHFRFS
jgi:hypothetical protein